MYVWTVYTKVRREAIQFCTTDGRHGMKNTHMNREQKTRQREKTPLVPWGGLKKTKQNKNNFTSYYKRLIDYSLRNRRLFNNALPPL
jgi:hypothetical protein